jgi:hypothetical protein
LLQDDATLPTPWQGFSKPVLPHLPGPERLGIFVCWISLAWLRLNGEHRKFCFGSASKIVVG